MTQLGPTEQGLVADFDLSPIHASSDVPDEQPLHRYVCWTRMQAEAGQSLPSIVQRKECERRHGDGHFFWGVGNAPARAINPLARQRTPVPVIFSEMKSKAKPVDTHPAQVLAWRRYLDVDDKEHPLPDHVLVTSKATITRANKLRGYYALMCFTNSPLELSEDGASFNHLSYRNFSEQSAPVGPSQVTALLKLTDACDDNPPTLTTSYQADLQAWLTGSYWVRLSDPVILRPEHLSALTHASDLEAEEWFKIVSAIRSSQPFPSDNDDRQSTLFSHQTLAEVP